MKFKTTEPLSLLEAAAKMAPDCTRTTLRSWIKEGRISVDGQVETQGASQVHAGQTLSMGRRVRYAPGNVRILFEDKHLVVVDKPEGLLTVATAYEKGETVHAILKAKYKPGKVFVVHRIDQDTSGVLMFARTERAQEELKKKLEKHDIERTYYAIVEGHLPKTRGTWESYQIEDGNYYVRNTTDASLGKLAITHYKVLDTAKRYSLLEIRLETGRKNQIRAHCQMADCPIVGDKKYGSKTNPLKRLGLHALFLGIVHPTTGQKLKFTSPLPKEFTTLFPRAAHADA